MKVLTVSDLKKMSEVECEVTDIATGKVTVKKIDFKTLCDRCNEAINTHFKVGRYSVLSEFFNEIEWTLGVGSACTDGIRIFFNPVFANELVSIGGANAMEILNAAKLRGEKSDRKEFEKEVFKPLFFVIIHEIYHQVYRHIEQAQRKEETKNGKNHDLANYSMDAEINRDIEIQWPEFKGITNLTKGVMRAKEFPVEFWQQIFDSLMESGDYPPMQSPMTPQGGQSDQQSGDDEGDGGQGQGSQSQQQQQTGQNNQNQQNQNGQGGQNQQNQNGQDGQNQQNQNGGSNGNDQNNNQNQQNQNQNGQGDDSNGQGNQSSSGQRNPQQNSNQNGSGSGNSGQEQQDQQNKQGNGGGQGQDGQNDQEGQNRQNGQDNQNNQNGQNGNQPYKASDKNEAGNQGDVKIKVSINSSWDANDIIEKEDGMKLAEQNDNPYTGKEKSISPEDNAKNNVSAAEDGIKGIGKGTSRDMGRILAEIDSILNKSVVDWKSLLAKHMKSAGGVDTEDRFSRKRLGSNRLDKYELVHRREIEVNRAADIFYLVDASGSIGKRELYRVFSEVMDIEQRKTMTIRKSAFTYFADGIDFNRIRLWEKDTTKSKKMKLITYEPGKDVGGGTEIAGSIIQVTKSGKKYFSKSNPETLMIVFTDGEDWITSLKKFETLPPAVRRRVVFCIMNNGESRLKEIANMFVSVGVTKNNIVCIDMSQLDKN